jgi:hypothetical protein
VNRPNNYLGRGIRMNEYTVRRYSFSELNEEARDKAIEETRSRLLEWLREEEITDYLEGKLEEDLGSLPEDITIAYSLSYCQGDGVALYGRIYKSEAPDLSWPEGSHYVDLVRNSWSNHYSHYNSFNVELSDENDEPIDLSGSSIEDQLRHLCKRLETLGYRYIENETNEISALQFLNDQESEEEGSFLEDGTRDLPRGIVQKVSA